VARAPLTTWQLQVILTLAIQGWPASSLKRSTRAPRSLLKTFMTRLIFQFCLAVTLLSLFLGISRAGEIIEGDTAGGLVTQGAVNSGTYNNNQNVEVGPMYYTDIGNVVEAFTLPYLAPGQTVTGATLSYYFVGYFNGTPNCNGQLYGLNRVSTTSAAALTSDWYAGTNDTANVLLNPTFITSKITAGQAITYSGSNLLSFVQKQYTNAAFSGLDTTNSRYVFFRISPDSSTPPQARAFITPPGYWFGRSGATFSISKAPTTEFGMAKMTAATSWRPAVTTRSN
jgi:hypothetical protein